MNGESSITQAAIAGDFAPIESYLKSHGVQSVTLCWDPDPATLTVPELAFLHDYWLKLPKIGALARFDALDPLNMRPALGNIMLLETDEAADDYRYRLYGSRVAEQSGFDLTGKCTRDLPTDPAIGFLFRVSYRASAQRKRPLFTRHVPPASVGVVSWSRIVLPLADETGAARHFLVGNVPGKGLPG
jgi:hypothetical protein